MHKLKENIKNPVNEAISKPRGYRIFFTRYDLLTLVVKKGDFSSFLKEKLENLTSIKWKMKISGKCKLLLCASQYKAF